MEKLKCPHCKKEIWDFKTTYEVGDGDGEMLASDIEDRMDKITQGEKEVSEGCDFYCPNCNAYLSINVTYQVKETKIEIIEEPDSDDEEGDEDD